MFIFLSTIKKLKLNFNSRIDLFRYIDKDRSAESEGLRCDSSWGLRIFSLSHAGDKTKNIFLYLFAELKTYNLSYSIYYEFVLFKACLFNGTSFRTRSKTTFNSMDSKVLV